jgi:hypothetical protein
MINTSTAAFRQDLLGPILQEGFPEDSYVSHRVLPTILVQKRNGIIPSFLYSNDQAMNLARAPKQAYARIVSELGQAAYNCSEAGIEEFLSPEDYEILGKDYAEMVITRRLVHNILRYRDIALSAAFFSATGQTTFAQNLVVAANTWDNTLGTPLNDIQTAMRNIALQTGMPGNAALIGYDLYITLCRNTQIQTLVRNVLGYSGARVEDATYNFIPAKVLASTFGLDELMVALGSVNAANEADTINDTNGGASRSFIWSSKYCLVFRKSVGNQDMREVALGRLFIYDLASSIGALAVGTIDTLRAFTLEWYRMEPINSDAFRCREYTDMEVLLAAAGALITNTHS